MGTERVFAGGSWKLDHSSSAYVDILRYFHNIIRHHVASYFALFMLHSIMACYSVLWYMRCMYYMLFLLNFTVQFSIFCCSKKNVANIVLHLMTSSYFTQSSIVSYHISDVTLHYTTEQTFDTCTDMGEDVPPRYQNISILQMYTT